MAYMNPIAMAPMEMADDSLRFSRVKRIITRNDNSGNNGMIQLNSRTAHHFIRLMLSTKMSRKLRYINSTIASPTVASAAATTIVKIANI